MWIFFFFFAFFYYALIVCLLLIGYLYGIALLFFNGSSLRGIITREFLTIKVNT